MIPCLPETKAEALRSCYEEQNRCRDHILSGKPDSAGAWMGLSDWIHEELEIIVDAAMVDEYDRTSLGNE